MREIYLATSALIRENFDAQRTIEEAKKNGFFGVQLFINPSYRSQEYVASLSDSLNQFGLGLIVHLPNAEIINPADINVAESLVSAVPDTKVIVHYLPATQLPIVKGTRVGWENSVNRPDFDHIAETRRKVAVDNTFFVFDFLRLMNTGDERIKEQAATFIKETIQSLRPKLDLIHIADKTSWEIPFREGMCPIGQGIVTEFLPEVLDFLSKDGRLVFEHEDLQMAIDSLRVFK